MEAEETVGDLPGGDERLTGLEEGGHPGGGADVGIEGIDRSTLFLTSGKTVIFMF